MRVLWFAVTPSLYASSSLGHNGGGWIASLEKLVRESKEIELGVAFEFQEDVFKVVQDGVAYYPINNQASFWGRIARKFDRSLEDQDLLARCQKIIDDFRPDVIHVFGSEWAFGLLSKSQPVPVVIHIQGLAIPYLNSYFPPNFGRFELLKAATVDRPGVVNALRSYRLFQHRASREKIILRECKYFMGRTHWDKQISHLFSPNSAYFYCSEALRGIFYQNIGAWKMPRGGKIRIVSAISAPLYKGMDLLLRTAEQLTNSKLDFEWIVFGIKSAKIAECFTRIQANEVNVRFGGSVSADELCQSYCNSHIFVHTSYIDNSPNSICEAQMLGIPVISTNVGGIATLVNDGETGCLCPANDPYSMAALILQTLQSPELMQDLSHSGVMASTKRHDLMIIKNDLISTYKNIVSNL